jgi:hypothetical protein
LLNKELLLLVSEPFELMMPLNIVTAAEGVEEDEDDDPDTVSDDDEVELP